MTTDLFAAYDATGSAWQDGPGRIYDRLADVVVEHCPGLDSSSVVLDLGAGTGAATRAVQRRGAHVIALDAAFGMLAGRVDDVPACVGDALALPFAARSFDAVVAAFSLNHVTRPADALREAARVVRLGGTLVASAYADHDQHPVKQAVDDVAGEEGWVIPEWYVALRRDAMPLLATVDRALGVAAAAGLPDASAEVRRVPFPDLSTADLVAWRTGMAHLAPFVRALDPLARERLQRRAAARIADAPSLVRSIIVLTALGTAQAS